MTAKKKTEDRPVKLNEIDDDIGAIAICAVRYAIGRQTYMPGLVQGFIMRHPEIVDANVRAVMIRDIDEADRVTEHTLPSGSILRIDHLGDTKIDRPGWERFREWLKGIGTKGDRDEMTGTVREETE